MRNKIIEFTGCPDYFIDPGITEFNHIPCFYIYEMVMLATLISFFELSYISAKLMFYNEITFKKELDSIVKSSPAYPVILVLHENV